MKLTPEQAIWTARLLGAVNGAVLNTCPDDPENRQLIRRYGEALGQRDDFTDKQIRVLDALVEAYKPIRDIEEGATL